MLVTLCERGVWGSTCALAGCVPGALAGAALAGEPNGGSVQTFRRGFAGSRGSLSARAPTTTCEGAGATPHTPFAISNGFVPAWQLAKLRIPEHKARVKDGHTTHGESSFGKKLWWAIIIALVGILGWKMWDLHQYNNAVREAEKAGFSWTCDDAISLIRQDWHNAFKKETWGAHKRLLDMGEIPDLGRYREMLHHLNPTVLGAWGCKDENLDALKGLTALQELYLGDCSALQNVDGIKGLTTLQRLSLYGCPALQNLDSLKGLTGLQMLFLNDCPALQNVDGLKDLTALQTLVLEGCDKIPTAALDELRAALPNLQINPTIPGL